MQLQMRGERKRMCSIYRLPCQKICSCHHLVQLSTITCHDAVMVLPEICGSLSPYKGKRKISYETKHEINF